MPLGETLMEGKGREGSKIGQKDQSNYDTGLG
jgi:hypothetical protein